MASFSKLALLVMHFPKLRILWSKSPHETLRIFEELKKNHDEVDVARAVEIGQSDSIESLLGTTGGSNGNDEDEAEAEVVDEVNEAARDMLLRLPGVNVHVARRIMQECDTLADLVEMSRDELRRVAGPVAGQKLFTFFRQKLDSSGVT
jgi:DNA excision repair protein ERCC-4